MPKLTKKLASEILGDVKLIEAGRADGRFGRVSNQGDVADDEPLMIFELPENWRRVMQHAAAFVSKDIETSIGKCSYVLDGATIQVAGPYAAAKLEFLIPEHGGRLICLPSEIAWHFLPGLGAAVLAIYADRLVIEQDVWSISSKRIAELPPAFDRYFKDEPGYELLEFENCADFAKALESAPAQITMRVRQSDLVVEEFESAEPWSPKGACFPLRGEEVPTIQPIAVDAALLCAAFASVGDAVLAVRGPLDPLQVMSETGAHVVLMPLKPTDAKAQGRAA